MQSDSKNPEKNDVKRYLSPDDFRDTIKWWTKTSHESAKNEEKKSGNNK